MFHFLPVHIGIPPDHRQPQWRLAKTAVPFLTVFCCSILSLTPSLAQQIRTGTAALQARTTSPFVGSAMAVLATLEEAKVLPPEGTREADRIIRSVIQLQSTFTKSSTPAIQQFLHDTLQRKYGTATETLLERFRSTGWTAEVLEALSERSPLASGEELQGLTDGLGQFNLSPDDLRGFLQLIRNGRLALAVQGKTLTEAYTAHRHQMRGQRPDTP